MKQEIETTKPSLIATIKGEIGRLVELVKKGGKEQAGKDARKDIVEGRAQLATLKIEAGQLRRFLNAKEEALARWTAALDEQVADSERAGLNYHERGLLALEKLRISLREAIGLIEATAALEKLARAEERAARESLERIQNERSLEEILADGPNATAAAKTRLKKAATAVRNTMVEWCQHQRERYRLRKALASAEATFSRSRSQHQADANRLRETLRDGLVARDDALVPHRARLRELTGSDGVEVS